MSLHFSPSPRMLSPQARRRAADEHRGGYGAVDAGLQSRHSFAGTSAREPAAVPDFRMPLDEPTPGKAAAPVRPGWAGCKFVVVNQFFERLAFYGLSGSIVLYLVRELGYSNAQADSQLALWTGVAFFFPLIGGWLADSVMGRFKAIMAFCVPYAAGLLLVALCGLLETPSAALFFTGIYLAAFGSGCLKPLLSSLGADQFDEADPAAESYWNYLYWVINMGACVSFTVLVYLCQNVSFSAGFTVAAVSLGVSVIILMAGSSRYYKAPPGGSALYDAMCIVKDAVAGPGGQGEGDGEALLALAASAPTWLDRASRRFGGRWSEEEVAGVRAVLGLVPFLLLFVVYWGINAQMTTTFFNQGCQMDLSFHGFTIPVAALNLFNSFIIIFLVPVFDQFIYPGLRRCGIECTTLQKMGAGMVVEALVMVGAAMLEVKRKELAAAGDFAGPSVCMSGDDAPMAVNLSVFYQVPLFVAIGTSEILASISAMEFFYAEAPDSMKSVCSALELLTVCCGQWLVAGLIPLVNSDPNNEWIPRDLNEGHLDWWFVLLAGLMGLNLLVYIWCANRHKSSAKPASATASL